VFLEALLTYPTQQVLGWVSLITVAGASFYFAKQNINERRRQQDIAGDRPSAKLDCEYHGYDSSAYIMYTSSSSDMAPKGRERIARDEAQAEQASRKELHSSRNPALVSSSSSSSKDDAT